MGGSASPSPSCSGSTFSVSVSISDGPGGGGGGRRTWDVCVRFKIQPGCSLHFPVQGSPGGVGGGGGSSEAAAVFRSQSGRIRLSNSCTGPAQARVCPSSTKRAAAAAHPAESVRSLKSPAAQRRRPRRFLPELRRLLSSIRPSVRFIQIRSSCGGKGLGSLFLVPPIDSRVSSVDRAASVPLQPIETEEGE